MRPVLLNEPPPWNYHERGSRAGRAKRAFIAEVCRRNCAEQDADLAVELDVRSALAAESR